MANRGNLIALSDAKAQQLQDLLRVLGPIAKQMEGMSIAFVGLRDAAGHNRLLKLIVADKEQSNPGTQLSGSLPPGGTDGQVLAKQSAADGDADWETPTAGGGVTYRELTHSITVAGTLPTTTEINTALAATYTDPTPDLVPANGDYVILTDSGATPKFIARVTTGAISASGIFARSFVVNSITYYATLSQCGLY